MHDNALLELNHKLNWHPCSQMKDYELFKPLPIVRARGSYIELTDGRKIIDAISSWWCKSLGHNHPRLKKALTAQLERFEHVMYANTTSDNIVELSRRLVNMAPNIGKVFYAGDGSCAVEIALKMSLHARLIKGEKNRTRFVALRNGYHGETAAAMSVSDLGLYREPYENILFKPILVDPLYVSSEEDPNWHDAKMHWQKIEEQLAQQIDTVTAIIVEPIVQGAGGMLVYSQDFLRRLGHFAKVNGVHLIVDEIMTGFGRTGKMLASEHAGIEPDLICLSKGLTSGWLSFSAVLATDELYELFHDDYASGKSFLHSHTFCGNAMGVALALATLDVLQEEKICDRVVELQKIMRRNMHNIAQNTGKLKNIRGIGAIVAADLDAPANERMGFRVYQDAVKLGALLRPLGNTIYWLPPLNVTDATVAELCDITQQAIVK